MSSNHLAKSLTEKKEVIVNNAQDAIINKVTSIAVFRGNTRKVEFARENNTSQHFFFVVSPNMKCNLHCRGCYAGSYPQKDKLSYETIDQTMKDAKTMGIYMVTVSGGEPFLREDIFDLFTSQNDIYFQVFTDGKRH